MDDEIFFNEDVINNVDDFEHASAASFTRVRADLDESRLSPSRAASPFSRSLAPTPSPRTLLSSPYRRISTARQATRKRTHPFEIDRESSPLTTDNGVVPSPSLSESQSSKSKDALEYFKEKAGKYECQWKGCTAKLSKSADKSTSSRTRHIQRHRDKDPKMENEKQRATTFFTRPTVVLSRTEFMEKVAKLAATKGLSFTTLGDVLFHDVLNSWNPSFKYPTRHEVKASVIKLSESIKQQHKINLAGVHGCIAFDETSSGKLRLLSTTVSWINKDFKFHHRRLPMKSLDSNRATGAYLASMVNDIIDEYGINVIAVTRDGASSGVLACSILDVESLHCFAHNTNLIVQGMMAGYATDLVLPIRELAASFKKASLMQNVLREAGSKTALKIPAQTRWSSVHSLISSFIANRCLLKNILSDPRVKSSSTFPKIREALKVDEAELIELNKFLGFFRDITKMAESKTAISSLIPYFKVIMLNQCKIAAADGEKPYIAQAVTQIHSRFKEYETSQSVKLASFFDPRFAMSSVYTTDEWDAITRDVYAICSPPDNEPAPTIVADEQQPAASAWTTFENSVTPNDIEIEVNTYKNLVKGPKKLACPKPGFDNFNDVLNFWHGNSTVMPMLSTEARRRVCQMVASSEPERGFSSLDINIADKHRCNLSPELTVHLETVREQTLADQLDRKTAIAADSYDDAASDIEILD